MLGPMIVVGLGGVGSEIVTRLESRVNKNKLLHKALFAVVDTDINTLNRIQREGFDGCVIQMSKNMTVKDYLSKNTEYSEWFKTTEGLNVKSMIEGAGQVRAISRLAFDMALRNGYFDDFEEKVNQLFQISEHEKYLTPRIIIVSSLAGGTGSGMALPFAFYIRRHFEEVLHTSSVIIKGMFIMPDVLNSIIGNTYEQISINANAYAAIKEIEAFVKKGEGYLSERYGEKLCLKLPDKALSKSQEVEGLSYNYCYLFGGKNREGNGLRSFQAYLDYTVECIYAQAFSPMQELNNSIEDNVFRIASIGVNVNRSENVKRFCSAGTAVLTYPYEKILEILALKKGDKILSEQWSIIDNEYFLECKKNEELSRKGRYIKNQTRSSFYVSYVNAKKGENSFIKKIYTDTLIEHGTGEDVYQKESWIEYWEAIEESIDAWLEDQPTLNKYYMSITDNLKLIEKYSYHRKASEFAFINSKYEELLKRLEDETYKKRSILGIEYFGNRMEDEYEDKAYYRYWLKKNDNYIHPNSIRFFLYNAIELFDEKREKLKQLVAEEEENIRNSQNRVWNKVNLSEKAVINVLFHNRAMEQKIKLLHDDMKMLKEYQRHVLLEQIAAKGREILNKLAKEYEEFYSVFDHNVQQYMKHAEDIKHSIQDVNGTVTRYVCCDDISLKNFENEIIDVRNEIEISGELSKVVFNIILDNMNERLQERNYHEVFQKLLVSYWKEELKEKYKRNLDLDILEALELEGKIHLKREERINSYIIGRINEMWGISGPFVGIQEGSMELFKNFCTYSALLEKKNDYTREQALHLLKASGGIADEDGAIDKYTIVFYQVIYALAPNSLKEIAIEWDQNKKEFKKGNISLGYFRMLANAKYSKMTPHIDWNWNRFDILPDFNLSYQKYLENVVYQMFIYQCALTLTIVPREDMSDSYCIMVGKERVEAHTLYEILIKYFINDFLQIEEEYEELRKQVIRCIYEGKTKAQQELVKCRKNWGKGIGGILGIIYKINVELGINKYDKALLWNMIYAFIDLLWDILEQFESLEKVKLSIKEIVLDEFEKYKDHWENTANGLIQQDIVYALNEKMQKKNIDLKL